MDEKELVEFLHEAGLHTYANPEAKTIPTPLRPGCDEYVYERGDWKYHDSYAWRKDGGGEEIVYHKGAPVWVMNYYGFLTSADDSKEIYVFLHDALRKRHSVLPVRGDALEDAARGMRYEIEFSRSEVGNFVGVERIFKNGAQVYECYFHGGYVR